MSNKIVRQFENALKSVLRGRLIRTANYVKRHRVLSGLVRKPIERHSRLNARLRRMVYGRDGCVAEDGTPLHRSLSPRSRRILHELTSIRTGRPSFLQADDVLTGDALSAVRDAAARQAPGELSSSRLADLARELNLSYPEPGRERRLFVDVSRLSGRDTGTGIQRVTRSVLHELLRDPPAGYRVEPVYATVNSDCYYLAKRFDRRFQGQDPVGVVDDVMDAYPGDLFLGLDFDAEVVISQREVLMEMYRRGVRVWFLVHDLLPVTMPQFFATPRIARIHENWLKTVALFDGVVCVSRSVADEYRSWLEAQGALRKGFQVCWSHNGADVERTVPGAGVQGVAEDAGTCSDHEPVFLMVGTIEPRKGHEQVLDAFELLWSQGRHYRLVIAGRRGWMTEEFVQRLEMHPRQYNHSGKRSLFWFEGPGDDELKRLYTGSTCLIAASYGEGFGLPLIEAAHHGLPLIVRDIPVFREVAGRHAYFFSAENERELADSIDAWAELYRRKEHPRSDAMPWLTWRQSTRNLLSRIMPDDKDGYAVSSNVAVKGLDS
ncbi:glycosyltransferase family 1 protein [Prosthecochloris sp. ZM_2]|uniref:glycosyltransferase family 4 protein n=1 Tax=Prosthecochloris sp. ZM_2 TaxID=2045206 RepID=UPI000DF7E8A0|nr:glycosyltransferase family 1 protein [Prosthecochloris sp. ZM_2]RNA64279.1 glycosyltransferase family 1 protein [Prosthecochloris sp. ZM_2]